MQKYQGYCRYVFEPCGWAIDGNEKQTMNQTRSTLDPKRLHQGHANLALGPVVLPVFVTPLQSGDDLNLIQQVSVISDQPVTRIHQLMIG